MHEMLFYFLTVLKHVITKPTCTWTPFWCCSSVSLDHHLLFSQPMHWFTLLCLCGYTSESLDVIHISRSHLSPNICLSPPCLDSWRVARLKCLFFWLVHSPWPVPSLQIFCCPRNIHQHHPCRSSITRLSQQEKVHSTREITAKVH